MGATSWCGYTPYLSDPEAALQVLRAEVFARGEFVDPTGPMGERLRRLAERCGLEPDSPEGREMIDDGLRLQRGIETGDMSGLSGSERSLVKRIREIGELARSLGSEASPGRPLQPRSIEELLELAAECGTHSILDIEHVAPRPGFALAAPATSASLRQAFGTAEPTREQVEEHWSDFAEGLSPWQARYLVVRRDGQPSEYAFIGCSGD